MVNKSIREGDEGERVGDGVGRVNPSDMRRGDGAGWEINARAALFNN